MENIKLNLEILSFLLKSQNKPKIIIQSKSRTFRLKDFQMDKLPDGKCFSWKNSQINPKSIKNSIQI